MVAEEALEGAVITGQMTDHLGHTVGAGAVADCLPNNFLEGQTDRQPHGSGLLAIG